MYPSTNAQSGSSENIIISAEATKIPTSPSPFFSKSYLDISFQEMFAKYDIIFEKQQE